MMSQEKEKRKSSERPPIVLDDLLPKRDVNGGRTSGIVFGVLVGRSADRRKNEQAGK